ncbi:hypothetical protein PR048_007854 [Dryococelus australis]|uniref:Uncharacterized protein n=1 Tax=Dryococelus australis TaxID=614101 RepID=A0ABQ9HVE9_9NEOP|nr:hypothetical protein PR048_007854 [Dryococelus australis]
MRFDIQYASTHKVLMGGGGEGARLLAYRLGELDSILGGFARGFTHVGIFPLVGGFLGGIPLPPSLHHGSAPHSPHFTHIGSQDLDVKSHSNLFTPLHGPNHLCIETKHEYPEKTSRQLESPPRSSERVSEEIWAALDIEVLRADEGGASRNERAGETVDTRENPPGFLGYLPFQRESNPVSFDGRHVVWPLRHRCPASFDTWGNSGRLPTRTTANEQIAETQKCTGAAVTERLDCSPPKKANPVSIPGWWKSCRTMPIWSVGFLGDFPFPPALAFRCCSVLTSFQLSSALKISLLRAAQISQLDSTRKFTG